MDIEEIIAYSLSKKGAQESFPFDDSTLVIKVGGKIFILVSLDGDAWINLKCDPEKAIELRESNPAISPGYHMSKKHWNTVVLDGSITKKLLFEMIDHSYELVFESLSTKIKSALQMDSK
jgi:predicted DNA-binding protein (MmcQ/YjbR family)